MLFLQQSAMKTTTGTERCEAQPEDEHLASGTQILAEVP
jgi:hypothetical protein